jgi:hypothetical protein
MRGFATEFEHTSGREVEMGAGYLKLTDARWSFLDKDFDRFLVAECGTGGERVTAV